LQNYRLNHEVLEYERVIRMSVEVTKKRDLHTKIVDEVLPHLADKLKTEGVISKHDRKPFTIPLAKDWPPLRIKPDRVLYLHDKKKVLVEIANPEKPKRFIGEIVYAHLLGHFNKIAAAIIFILPIKGQRPTRDIVQNMMLHFILKEHIPSIVIGWSGNHAYWQLKYALTKQLFRKKP